MTDKFFVLINVGNFISKSIKIDVSDPEIMVKARKFVCAKIFDGEPKLSDFELQTEELPTLKDGGNLFASVFFFYHFFKLHFSFD